MLLGADFYEDDGAAPARADRRSASAAMCVLDRVIVDKNARIGDGVHLVNDERIDHADGDGYYIRDGDHHRPQRRHGGDRHAGVRRRT